MKNQRLQVTAASLGVGVGVGIGIAGFQPPQLLPSSGGVDSAAGQETGVPHCAVTAQKVAGA